MNRLTHLTSRMILPALGLALLTGCAAFQAYTVPVNERNPGHMDEQYDATDMLRITRHVSDAFLASPFLIKHEEPPVMMIAGVQNRTSDYVDTKNVTDRLRTLLLESGKTRFINEARRGDLLKEQGYQAEHANPETQVAIGRQLGATYMISGSLTEIKKSSPKQVRVSKQVMRYYKFTVEVTDLESSEIVWIKEEPFARQISKPLIGW